MLFTTRVKRIYPVLHALLLVGGFLWCRHVNPAPREKEIILIALLVYAVLILILNRMFLGRLLNTTNQYFLGQFFDSALIAVIIKYTGGLNSDFYLAFFPVVTLASVFCAGWRSVVGAIWYAICYLAAVYDPQIIDKSWETGLLRMASIWSVGLVAYSVTHFMHSSERKLLRTLDVLNERTWELESSQLQLSNIYETTRALSGILDLENLLGEILRVAQMVFRFQKCGIYLSNAAGDCLYLHAALESGNRHIYKTPLPYGRDVSGLVELQDQSRILSHLNRGKRNPGSNELDFPLISRGKVLGVMQVTAESGNLPSSRDRRLLIIFASAVAVAIDNSLLHKKTEELTIIDALTEIYNYRYFREKLLGELRRADRYRHKLSILMLDLDHFKQINDQHGHQTGNVILREVSNIIKECIRDIDIVARYGGEEFVVILPQTDEEDARIIAERIRETVDRCFFPNSRSQREIRLTVSLGVATYPEGVHTIEQLLEKVDKALYRAKTEGRNRVFIAEKPRRRTAEFSQ